MARSIKSYEQQGFRAFRPGRKADCPFKAKDIVEAWRRGYNEAKLQHAKREADAKVVRWQGHGGSFMAARTHTEYTLRGDAPAIRVHRSLGEVGWFVTVHDYGIIHERLRSDDIQDACAEALVVVSRVLRKRIARIQAIMALSEIGGVDHG